MRDNELDALIEQVEQMVGMGHAAWDTINPREIAAAFCKALAAPAEGDGLVARFTPSDADRHRCDNCGLRITDHVPDEEGACCKREAVRQLREILHPAATAQVPERIVLWSRNVAPHWYFVAKKSQRADIEGAPVYETLDPIVLKGSPEAAPAAPKGGVVDEVYTVMLVGGPDTRDFLTIELGESSASEFRQGQRVRVLAIGEDSNG